MDEGKRVALIVACDRYSDPELKQLQAPHNDAKALARILENPDIGGYKVEPVIDQPYWIIKEKINELIKLCSRKDTLLLYFSCHGIKDVDGHLYFATINTNCDLLHATAVESNFVNNMLDNCRAQQKVLLLDCCYSGAYEKGRVVKANAHVNPNDFFGKGRVVITASGAMQYALEGYEKVENLGKKGSYFTNALIEGVETGKADANEDGMITYEELFHYIHDYVGKITPNQTPTLSADGVEGDIVIFKNVRNRIRSGKAVPFEPTSPIADLEIVKHQGTQDSNLEFIDKARMLLEEKQYGDAIKIFDTILMLRSEHVEALNGKGMALYKQKKYEEASQCFKKVLKIKPTHSVASDYLEMTTDRLGKRGTAEVKSSNKDIKQEAELEKRTEEKVINDLNNATDQFPVSNSGIVAGADLRYPYNDTLPQYKPPLDKRDSDSSQPLSKPSQQNGAEYATDADSIIRHNNNDDPDSLCSEGSIHAHARNYLEALKCFDRAIQLNPNKDAAWHGKGYSLHKLERYEEALKCFDRAIQLNPYMFVVWQGKGDSLSKLGRYEEARKCFDKAEYLRRFRDIASARSEEDIRFAVLDAIYAISEANKYLPISQEKLFQELQVQNDKEQDLIREAFESLHKFRLVQGIGSVSITPQGIRVYEGAIVNPIEYENYFPLDSIQSVATQSKINEIQSILNQRGAFYKKALEFSRRNPNQPLDAMEIGNGLGYDNKTSERIYQYLVDEGSIKSFASGTTKFFISR